ncbi:hypothetical protein D0T50_06520 [Bacteroides sp. 214]|uniref:VanZ family protein n=1 Tax=Bacteroides sp. 214 TaxID=2302935 RepID=UPI0013D0E882|nr:VanZ family protein [Bacteroides sp. 214]NDW12543.1 hypothetical protein [Bacteroides sp. 214]
MPHYIKKYPLSIIVTLVIVYLSFFKPPSGSLPTFPHMDKIVHFLMYAGLSGMLWLEFIRNHQKAFPVGQAWIVAFLFPVALSGCIEILQEYCTSYRGGEWGDFGANTTGALCASLFAFYVLKPFMLKTGKK